MEAVQRDSVQSSSHIPTSSLVLFFISKVLPSIPMTKASEMSLFGKHNIASQPFLPREIRDMIYTHLLSDNLPIWFDLVDNFKPHNPNVQQALNIIDLILEAREIFYRANIFRVDHQILQKFLRYSPPRDRTSTSSVTTPKVDVTHLIIDMQPDLHWPNHDPVPALRSLFKCPRLKSVVIQVHGWRIEDLQEYDPTFKQITDICIELGDRLGEQRLMVVAEGCYASRTWYTADFRRGL